MKKTNMKNILTMVVALGACTEPYSVDENADKTPAVAEIQLYDGTTHADLSGGEGAALRGQYTEGTAIFPSQYPRVLFNKLLDGSTLESVARDETQPRAQGNCLLADLSGGAPLTIEVGGQEVAASSTWACWSPSDRSLELREFDFEAAAPKDYLPYDADYVINLTNKIKDKKGTSLPPSTITLPVRPFEVLSVTSADHNDESLYGAPGTAFEDLVGKVPANHAVALRILFSGPVAGDKGQSGLLTAVLRKGTEELTGKDPMNKVVRTVVASVVPGSEDAVSDDARVAFIFPPAYQLSDGEMGFEPGTYTLTLPTGVTDDGSVTGSPVALKAKVEIRFTIDAAVEEAQR